VLPAEDPAARVNLRPVRDAAESGYGDSLAGGIGSFNSRVVAAAIDLLVAFGVIVGLSWLLPDFAGRLAQLTGIAYFITRDSLPFLGGQSVGKKAMRLKVTTSEGDSIVKNWQVALIRNGVLLIPFFALVEVYVLLTRDTGVSRGRRLGDEWAKTRVIVEEPLVLEEGDDSKTPSPPGLGN
jgi:uncharacterized RDD family membrane protein YckC